MGRTVRTDLITVRCQSIQPREPTSEKKRMAPLIFYCTHRSVILSGSIEKKPAETVT